MADRGLLKLKSINERLSEYQLQGMEGVTLVGDIEIELDMNYGDRQLLARYLGRKFTNLALLLFDFSRVMGYPVNGTIK